MELAKKIPLLLIVKVFSVLTILCVFFPTSPAMPAEDLDSSWKAALNQAVTQGLSFGREVVFTFGPYASIYTKMYHPSTYTMMWAGSLHLAFSYILAFLLLVRKSPWPLLLLFSFVFTCVGRFREIPHLTYPLLLGLLYVQNFGAGTKRDARTWILLSLLFFPLGMIPLIKGTMTMFCMASVALIAGFSLIQKKTSDLIPVLLSPLLSLVFFWLLSGQKLSDLPVFFTSMSPIISGYTDAMAINGKKGEIFLYWLISLGLLGAIGTRTGLHQLPKLFLFALFSLFLFISFKAGFTRHDGHAMISSALVITAAVIFALAFPSRYMLVLLFFGLIAGIRIDSNYYDVTVGGVWREVTSTYLSAAESLKDHFVDKNRLPQIYQTSLQRLGGKLPPAEGTADLYTYEQAYVLASGNPWSPRPVLQSYSAFTPSLAFQNRDHLLGEKAPENVFFKVLTIDARFPSLDDGPSWPVLLRHYKPGILKNDFLHLRKLSERPREVLVVGENKIHSMGEIISIPESQTPVFVECSIKPNIFGKLAKFFFKSTPLWIVVNMKDGSSKTFRIIPAMAEAGFIISPLIENTGEFSKLYGYKSMLKHKQVKSFFIVPASGRWLWKGKFEVSFKTLAQ